MDSNKIAIVTGAAGTIGHACVVALLDGGYTVVLADRSPAVAETMDDLPAGRTHAEVVDLGDAAQLSAFVSRVGEKFGRIDALVNNAAIHPKNAGQKYLLEDIELEQWNAVMAVNLTAPFLLFQKALPYMRGRGFGRVINISSRAGRSLSPIAAAHYSASKAGLIGLTRVMASEAAQHGITANCVAPGPVLTTLSTNLEEVRAAVAKTVPLGRYGDAAEVASAVAYLASEGASFVTGAIIDVNGGTYMP